MAYCELPPSNGTSKSTVVHVRDKDLGVPSAKMAVFARQQTLEEQKYNKVSML